MVVNCGAAFGVNVPGLVILSSLVWVGVMVFSWKNKSMGGIIMMLGGAGNLWQRITKGCVVDNLPIPIVGGYNNWWDWLVVTGGLIVGYELWKKNQK